MFRNVAQDVLSANLAHVTWHKRVYTHTRVVSTLNIQKTNFVFVAQLQQQPRSASLLSSLPRGKAARGPRPEVSAGPPPTGPSQHVPNACFGDHLVCIHEFTLTTCVYHTRVRTKAPRADTCIQVQAPSPQTGQKQIIRHKPAGKHKLAQKREL